MYALKNGEQEGKKNVLSGSWHQWEGEDIRKGCRRVNTVEYYIHMKMERMRPVETIPGMERG
jgi:hypothetical protein